MKHDHRGKLVEENCSFFWPAATFIAVFALAGCSGTESNGPAGGSVGVGGSTNFPSTGGVSSAGGESANATGGTATIATGGTVTIATGGTTQGAATGGQSSGTWGTGIGTGGKSATGGTTAAGGTTSATGGKSATGGTTAAGGTTSVTGGATATGGENTGANCAATAAPLLSAKNPKLPDPFALHSGTRITAKTQWECRRNEIKKDIEKYEIGTKPEPATVAATVATTPTGTTLSVKVTNSSGSITLTSTVSGSGSCVVIGMNGNSSLVSGCTQVPFMHDQVVGYNNGSGTQNQSDPFYKLYPSQWGKVGNYAAWSWGISRLIDGLEQVKAQLKIDTTKIAVHGCSYAGKMALFGGAFDERVALTVAQESGGGGITSWRTSQDFTTRTGTNIEKIDNTSYAWFLSSMKSLDPYSLPHDHHELVAMIAPRALIALGNPGYEWLGDESGYKSITAAAEVWKALGVPENIGFDFTGGHSHCAAAASQTASVNAFVNKFLKGQTANTAIAIKPVSTKFDLTYTNAWTTPTLQ